MSDTPTSVGRRDEIRVHSYRSGADEVLYRILDLLRGHNHVVLAVAAQAKHVGKTTLTLWFRDHLFSLGIPVVNLKSIDEIDTDGPVRLLRAQQDHLGNSDQAVVLLEEEHWEVAVDLGRYEDEKRALQTRLQRKLGKYDFDFEPELVQVVLFPPGHAVKDLSESGRRYLGDLIIVNEGAVDKSSRPKWIYPAVHLSPVLSPANALGRLESALFGLLSVYDLYDRVQRKHKDSSIDSKTISDRRLDDAFRFARLQPEQQDVEDLCYRVFASIVYLTGEVVVEKGDVFERLEGVKAKTVAVVNHISLRPSDWCDLQGSDDLVSFIHQVLGQDPTVNPEIQRLSTVLYEVAEGVEIIRLLESILLSLELVKSPNT